MLDVGEFGPPRLVERAEQRLRLFQPPVAIQQIGETAPRAAAFGVARVRPPEKEKRLIGAIRVVQGPAEPREGVETIGVISERLAKVLLGELVILLPIGRFSRCAQSLGAARRRRLGLRRGRNLRWKGRFALRRKRGGLGKRSLEGLDGERGVSRRSLLRRNRLPGGQLYAVAAKTQECQREETRREQRREHRPFISFSHHPPSIYGEPFPFSSMRARAATRSPSLTPMRRTPCVARPMMEIS